jgi:hypothetical protein
MLIDGVRPENRTGSGERKLLTPSCNPPHRPQARQQQRRTDEHCHWAGYGGCRLEFSTHTTVAEGARALSAVVARIVVRQVVRSWGWGGCWCAGVGGCWRGGGCRSAGGCRGTGGCRARRPVEAVARIAVGTTTTKERGGARHRYPPVGDAGSIAKRRGGEATIRDIVRAAAGAQAAGASQRDCWENGSHHAPDCDRPYRCAPRPPARCASARKAKSCHGGGHTPTSGAIQTRNVSTPMKCKLMT